MSLTLKDVGNLWQQCLGGWVSEWVDECGWVDECVGGWMSVWVCVWVSEWVDE